MISQRKILTTDGDSNFSKPYFSQKRVQRERGLSSGDSSVDRTDNSPGISTFEPINIDHY